jgi:ArsR family transcriptional regulator, arsenate/arsenite/antimonite-responsive transcriptional repressor
MKRDKLESYEMELFFRALADRTRLRLLNLMGDDEVCVCFLVEALKLTQPKISRHLAYLRRAGIVASRRDGKWMHYRLTQPNDGYAAGVLSAVRDWLVNDPVMQSDRGRLLRLCCSPTLPAALRKAPKPTNIATAH